MNDIMLGYNRDVSFPNFLQNSRLFFYSEKFLYYFVPLSIDVYVQEEYCNFINVYELPLLKMSFQIFF